MAKVISTFQVGDKLLIGSEAKEAWAAQSARCACGDHGEAESAVSGSCKDMSANWLGCPNCGTAVGRPLIFRTQSQINFRLAEIHDSKPGVIAAKEAKREAEQVKHLADLERGWDGYQFIGVEAGRAKAEAIRTGVAV